MAKAIVKCPYCSKQFDRNDPAIKWVKIGRRYAHKECYQKYQSSLTQKEKDLNNLIEYIKNLLGDDYVFMKVKKQIQQYHDEYQYSYSGMLSTLKYFYEVKNNSTEKSGGGIGIIPYVYKDAYQYYYQIYLAQQKNKTVHNYKQKVEEITIPSPRAWAAPIKLWFEGEED